MIFFKLELQPYTDWIKGLLHISNLNIILKNLINTIKFMTRLMGYC